MSDPSPLAKKQKVESTSEIPEIQGLEDYTFRDGEDITPAGAMPQVRTSGTTET